MCGCMWGLPAVGACLPLGLECGIGRPPPRDSDAHSSPRAQKGDMQHSTHTPRARCTRVRTPASHAHTAHTPRRHVPCGTRDAERRGAQHSAAQHMQAAHARHTIRARKRTTYTCRAHSRAVSVSSSSLSSFDMWLCVGAPSVLPGAHCLPLADWLSAAPFPGSGAGGVEGWLASGGLGGGRALVSCCCFVSVCLRLAVSLIVTEAAPSPVLSRVGDSFLLCLGPFFGRVVKFPLCFSILQKVLSQPCFCFLLWWVTCTQG